MTTEMKQKWEQNVWDAVNSLDSERLENLLQEDYDINIYDKLGRHILSRVVMGKRPTILKILLTRKDLNVNARSLVLKDSNYTPLMIAFLYNRLDNIKELLKREDVDVNATISFETNTTHNQATENVLGLAIRRGNVDMLAELLKRKDLKVNDYVYTVKSKYITYLTTPIVYAGSFGHESTSELIKVLTSRKDLKISEYEFKNFKDVQKVELQKRYENEQLKLKEKLETIK